MKVTYDKPIKIKIWFQGCSTSRNIDFVRSMEQTGSMMEIKYKPAHDAKTVLVNMQNVNMIEEL